MFNTITRTLIISIDAVGLMLLIGGCGKADKPAPEAKKAQEGAEPAAEVAESADALAYVYTADALYTCPAHPILISDDAEAMCPRCNAKLEKMSDEDVAELRASHPKGCASCVIVVPGDSPMENCPKCGMALVSIPEPQPAETAEVEPETHEH